jgi:hypothetical protein
MRISKCGRDFGFVCKVFIIFCVSGQGLLCMRLLEQATSRFANFSSLQKPMSMRNATGSGRTNFLTTDSARTTPALVCAFENAGAIVVSFANFHPLLCFSSDTALLLSSVQGHPEICKFLVVSGADVNVKDDEYDARPCIAHSKMRARLRYCLQRFHPLLCFRLWTPLHWLSLHGHLDICQLLVASKADVCARDRCGRRRRAARAAAALNSLAPLQRWLHTPHTRHQEQ